MSAYMDIRHTLQRAMQPVGVGLDHGEEVLAEVDEPPDERYDLAPLTHKQTSPSGRYTRAPPPMQIVRRESLLTRQLHSENEHTEDDESIVSPIRGLSTVSTWSNQSTASTAELTSDDGRSVPSPTISPPLPPTQVRTALPSVDKIAHDDEPKILGLDSIARQAKAGTEQSVEAGLGRKRCITFACGNKDKIKTSTPATTAEKEKPAASSPPKRKCTLQFVCPTRVDADNKPVHAVPMPGAPKRHPSPPPRQRRQQSPSNVRAGFDKVHRGSDSTVTHASPKSIRKNRDDQSPSDAAKIDARRTLSNDSDDSGGEGMRFHEFANSDDEQEEWVQESTCHLHRLTVSDTLKKENVIRQLGEEVEEEALEDDEDMDEEIEGPLDNDDEMADIDIIEEVDEDEEEDDEDDEAEEDEEEDDESDAGFHSDDEHGFAVSDSEGEGSDTEWWTPGGISTAATSTDHLEHLAHMRLERVDSGSSIDSVGPTRNSPRKSRRYPRRRPSRPDGLPIARPGTPDLPDSTDFVCGTLDEDRPLEQAYINAIKERQARNHKPLPQDIDPTFPTSDPELDEEDDEDLDDGDDSDGEAMMHGSFEGLHDEGTVRPRSPRQLRRRSLVPRSPPPPHRHHSPAPTAVRVKSPAPMKRRSSPAPIKRNIPRSPPPRKLFGQSPGRHRSPAPNNRMTSPPNTRRTSPDGEKRSHPISMTSGLGERPNALTHTASLPRGGGFLLSRLGTRHGRDLARPHHATVKEDEDTDSTAADAPRKKRGAIDIVKGLEKKRQRRREKLLQKACQKKEQRGEKVYKIKPGKGCERMREVGLELQRYRGNGEHILSV